MPDPFTLMTAETITKTFLVELTKRLTSSLLNSNWSNDTLVGKNLLVQLQLPHISQKYVENYASNVLKMRTLWSDDADIYLDSIYTPLSISSASNKDVIIIGDGQLIRNISIVNIIGIAGQGKSTILRKLFYEELKAAQKIPFFLELRKIENGDILDSLRKVLKDIGCTLEEGYLEFLLQSGKVVLMLDGFDEVSSVERALILSKIVQLKERYNCQVITTSRPDTEICSEVGIKNFYVNNLVESDIINIISNFKNDSDAISELPSLIKENSSLRETLITPILVNLLCICYPALDTVPDNVKDFYSSLFVTLYSKHDKLKNYKRETKAKVPVMKSYDIFNAFCFNTLKNNIFEFSEADLVHYFSKAQNLTRIDTADARDVTHDIVSITCLIQRDGYDNFVFLHKSVQEFHAAMFIHRFRSSQKAKLYDYLGNVLVVKDGLDNMASYLKQLSEEDYLTNILLPTFERFNIHKFNINPDSIVEDLMKKCFSKSTAILCEYEKGVYDLDEDLYEVESLSSMDYHRTLTGLTYIATGNRSINHELGLDRIISKQEKTFYLDKSHSVNGFSKSQIFHDVKVLATNSYTRKVPFNNEKGYLERVTYQVPLIDLAKALGIYELLTSELNSFLSQLYNDYYLPCYKYFEESDLTFELELDIDN
ncbi:NACHT domain-containing protein [Vibrio parahaemolyticus]|uniref:NACHT domain-containing protein n=1 Tax=Vibrio parahaemolyticus TaxID=670 RepID=UPI002269A036|nr:NACHT domain-containing protein [Vibrio parahaemolyticus]MCX8946461.1 NACHT domain-containing protein [Vibrio parahaemolyticus]